MEATATAIRPVLGSYVATSSPGNPLVLSKVLLFLRTARPRCIPSSLPSPAETTEIAFGTRSSNFTRDRGPPTTWREKSHRVFSTQKNCNTVKNTARPSMNTCINRNSGSSTPQMVSLSRSKIKRAKKRANNNQRKLAGPANCPPPMTWQTLLVASYYFF